MSVRTFTSTGYWTAPAGVSSIQVECWGSGAGGRLQSGVRAGYGSGGGAYSKANAVPVFPGMTATIAVGTGGASNTNGNDTYYLSPYYFDGTLQGDHIFCKAVGGLTTAGGSDSDCIGDVKYSGGNGGLCNNTAGAGGGEGAGTDSSGHNGTVCVSSTTGSAGGTGGNGGDGGKGGDFAANGSNGASTGGGGGGAGWGSPAPTGGVGGAGKAVLTWVDGTNIVTNVITVIHGRV
jgi:hypothetical protein